VQHRQVVVHAARPECLQQLHVGRSLRHLPNTALAWCAWRGRGAIRVRVSRARGHVQSRPARVTSTTDPKLKGASFAPPPSAAGRGALSPSSRVKTTVALLSRMMGERRGLVRKECSRYGTPRYCPLPASTPCHVTRKQGSDGGWQFVHVGSCSSALLSVCGAVEV
jgi:hypothetical protein